MTTRTDVETAVQPQGTEFDHQPDKSGNRLASRKERDPPDPLALVPLKAEDAAEPGGTQTPDLQNCDIINVCHVKPLNEWSLSPQ